MPKKQHLGPFQYPSTEERFSLEIPGLGLEPVADLGSGSCVLFLVLPHTAMDTLYSLSEPGSLPLIPLLNGVSALPASGWCDSVR